MDKLEQIELGACPTCGGPTQFIKGGIIRRVDLPSIPDAVSAPSAKAAQQIAYVLVPYEATEEQLLLMFRAFHSDKPEILESVMGMSDLSDVQIQHLRAGYIAAIDARPATPLFPNAVQIIEKISRETIKYRTDNSVAMFDQYKAAEILEQALSDSLRPYRVLIEKWREQGKEAHNDYITDMAEKDAYNECADELEAQAGVPPVEIMVSDRLVLDAAMIIKRMLPHISNTIMKEQVTGWLNRNNLMGSPLRDHPPSEGEK